MSDNADCTPGREPRSVAASVCYKTVNGYHVSLRHHRSIERNSSFSHLVSTEFLEATDVEVEQNFVEMGDRELPVVIQYSVGANFVLFVTNWLHNSGNMKAVSTLREPDVR